MKTKLLFIIMAAFACMSANAQTQLWGTAGYGGASDDGTIFYSDGSGNNFQTAYSFDQPSGKLPMGNMVLADNGSLYGETDLGGFGDSCVIYRYNPSTGIYTNIHDLYQYISLGWGAYGGMIKGTDGMLYGLCSLGGAYGAGAIFRIDPNTDAYTDIHDMVSIDGGMPMGGLIQLSDGKLYGMTYNGGATGNGAIFSFDPATSVYTRLYSFEGSNGGFPMYGKLMQGTDGKLYGMTPMGGQLNFGVIFSFDLSTNTYNVLHEFNIVNGKTPRGSLVQATNGLLYGMTYMGGANNAGVLFSFDLSSNTQTVLLDFNGTNGSNPQRGLTAASNGLLYGTVNGGGDYAGGVAFSYNTLTNTYTKLHDFNASTTGRGPDCEIIETPMLVTGLKPVSNTNGLNVFPNPASSFLSIMNTGKAGEIKFYDVTGREIYSVESSAAEKTVVNISEFPNLFFVKTPDGVAQKVVRK